MSAVDAIGETIADELRGLIDYHNCRVFVRDGEDLLPIAFRGELTHTESPELAVLATRVGRGVTGRVAETGEPLLIPDAANCEFGHKIEGTAEIEESLLAVPLTHAGRVVGVIVISKLGLDQFDADDLRLLQVLAGHTSSALVNAQLYETLRREAESAKALLELSRELAAGMELTRSSTGSPRCRPDPRVLVRLGLDAAAGRAASNATLRGRRTGSGSSVRSAGGYRRSRSERATSVERPFLVEPEQYADLVDRHVDLSVLGSYAIAPLRFDIGARCDRRLRRQRVDRRGALRSTRSAGSRARRSSRSRTR